MDLEVWLMVVLPNKGFVGNSLTIDPSESEFAQMEKRMCVVQTKNLQRIIYLDMQGGLDFDEI